MTSSSTSSAAPCRPDRSGGVAGGGLVEDDRDPGVAGSGVEPLDEVAGVGLRPVLQLRPIGGLGELLLGLLVVLLVAVLTGAGQGVLGPVDQPTIVCDDRAL